MSQSTFTYLDNFHNKYIEYLVFSFSLWKSQEISKKPHSHKTKQQKTQENQVFPNLKKNSSNFNYFHRFGVIKIFLQKINFFELWRQFPQNKGDENLGKSAFINLKEIQILRFRQFHVFEVEKIKKKIQFSHYFFYWVLKFIKTSKSIFPIGDFYMVEVVEYSKK